MPTHGKTTRPARRWKRLILAAIAALVVLLLIYPLWFPWVLKPLAGKLGAQFAEYHREGYSRIELSGVTWSNRSTAVSIGQLDVQLPHQWLFDWLTGATNAEPQIAIQDWRFESRPEKPSPPSERRPPHIDSTSKLLDELQTNLPPIRAWIHNVTATNGVMALGGKETEVPALSWQNGVLQGQARGFGLSANLQNLADGTARLSASNEQASARLTLARTNSDWDFTGDILWESNQFNLQGSFDRTNWFPSTASLVSDQISLSPRVIGLQGLSDLQGSAHAMWTNKSYSFDIHFQAHRLETAEWIPDQIAAHLAGDGDLNELTVKTLAIEMPHLNATLNRPLTIGLSGPVLGQQTTLDLSADLSQMESIPLNGLLSGQITLEPEKTTRLRAAFHLEGTDLSGFGVQSKSVRVAGSMNWPVLQLTNVSARFPSGGTLAAGLEMNLVDRRVAQSHWQFDGVLPLKWTNTVRLGEVHSTGTFQGAWPELTHTGRVEVADVQVGKFRAAQVRGEWNGQGLALTHYTVHLENGASTLAMQGRGEMSSTKGILSATLGCSQLDLKTVSGTWSLAKPAQLRLHRKTDQMDFELSPLELADADSRIAVNANLHWPSNGVAAVTLTNLRSADVSGFLVSDLPKVTVPGAHLRLQWTNGPLTFESSVQAQWQQASNSVWKLDCTAASDGKRLRVDSARLGRNESSVAECDLNLPLRIEPTGEPKLQITDAGEPATVDVRVLDEKPFWRWIEHLTGVKIQQPNVEFHAKGPVKSLQGELSIKAARVEWANARFASNAPPPAVDNLVLNAEVGLGGLTITQATARLQGQPLELQGHWDIGAADWSEWIAALHKPDLHRITGKLMLHDAKVSSLVVFAPNTVAPVGSIDLDLELKPEMKFDGHVAITNAATQPFDPLGTVRNIDADIDLNGWQATVNHLHATLGGRPVSVSGQGEWRPQKGLQFDLKLAGTNLSLLHDPDLIVRADLDLRAHKVPGQSAQLTGGVRLRHSLLFRDFSSMVSRSTERPKERPPYFSVQAEPFADWQLDVRVRGDQFLDVLSTAFKGEVSADLSLSGTLREPIAVGEVVVDSGRVLFPFGTLQVERARVSLLRQNPYRPQLDVVAEGQNFGYNLTINVEGPADAPTVVMQSVPPLTTQQILLMLTAGQIPRSDINYSSLDKVSQVGYYLGKEFINRFIGNTSASERLVVRSGENVTDEGKPTYSIEYKFTDRWSVFGEYNRFRDFNSGLKFKVLSK